MSGTEHNRDTPLIPKWGIYGGLIIILATAIAAPFYRQTAEALLWVGETLKTMCGW
jgi:hypothetical protein